MTHSAVLQQLFERVRNHGISIEHWPSWLSRELSTASASPDHEEDGWLCVLLFCNCCVDHTKAPLLFVIFLVCTLLIFIPKGFIFVFLCASSSSLFHCCFYNWYLQQIHRKIINSRHAVHGIAKQVDDLIKTMWKDNTHLGYFAFHKILLLTFKTTNYLTTISIHGLGWNTFPVIYENKTEINGDFSTIFIQIFSTFVTEALDKILTISHSDYQIRCTNLSL